MVCSPGCSMHPACRDPNSSQSSPSGKLVERDPSSTLQSFLEFLQLNLQLKRPSLTNALGVVFMQNPEVLRKAHSWKLTKGLSELAAEGVFTNSIYTTAGEELCGPDKHVMWGLLQGTRNSSWTEFVLC